MSNWFRSGKFKRRKKNQPKEEAVQITSLAAVVTQEKIEIPETVEQVQQIEEVTVTQETVEAAPITAYKLVETLPETVKVEDINYDIIESDDGKAYVVNEKGVWIRHNTGTSVQGMIHGFDIDSSTGTISWTAGVQELYDGNFDQINDAVIVGTNDMTFSVNETGHLIMTIG